MRATSSCSSPKLPKRHLNRDQTQGDLYFARGGSAGTRRHTPRGSPSAPPLHDPNPGPPTLDLSLALRLTLRLTLTLTLTLTLGLTLTLILNLTPTRRCPAPASYSPVTAHPALGTCATKKPAHHLVAFAVNIDG